MAESREDAQADTAADAAPDLHADERAGQPADENERGEEAPADDAASIETAPPSSWGPPELEGYTIHGPGWGDRPHLSWTARHAGADLYFIDVSFGSEPHQTIGPLPAREVVPHMAAREAQARRAYDDIAGRFARGLPANARPPAFAAAEVSWPPVFAMPVVPQTDTPPHPADPPDPEPVTQAPPPALPDDPMTALGLEPSIKPDAEQASSAPRDASAPAPPSEPAAPVMLKASGVLGTSHTIKITLRAKPAAPGGGAAEPAADKTTEAIPTAALSATATSSHDFASPAGGAKGVLMQSIARASQLFHAPKLTLRTARAAARVPEPDESGQNAAPAAAPTAGTKSSEEDRVLRDIQDVLARRT